jgi:hypothetical protein
MDVPIAGYKKGWGAVGLVLLSLSCKGFILSLLAIAAQLHLVHPLRVSAALDVFAVDLLLCASCFHASAKRDKAPVSLSAYRRLKCARNQAA